jgi:hypothetical protein
MYCEKKNIIFIHIPKTAGSTVELMLEPYLDDQSSLIRRDVNNWDWDDDVEVHVKHRQYRNAKHWTLSEHYRYCKLSANSEIKSFTVVRNPYERMLKLFLFKLQNGEFLPVTGEPGYNESREKPRGKHITRAVLDRWDHNMFIEFLSANRNISRMGKQTFLSAWSHCELKNNLGVNYVVKYENFQSDLISVFNNLDLPVPAEIPITNSTLLIDRDQLKSYYNSTSRRIVEDVYHNDFEPFGYEKWN